MHTGVEPRLPTDLEREILEIAAISQPSSIPTLILVAHRVKAWIEPLLYRVLSISDAGVERFEGTNRPRITHGTCLELIDSRTSSFFHDHVRHLSLTCVYGRLATLKENLFILSKCTGIVNLELSHVSAHPTLLPVMSTLPLVRLVAALQLLFGPSVNIDFGHKLFSRLTHLDIWDSCPCPTWPVGLGQLPRLTHLSLSWPVPTTPDIFRGFLAHCPRLEILAVIFRTTVTYSAEDYLPHYRFFEEDPRSVVIIAPEAYFQRDWELGADGGDDHWVIADRFVRKRRLGKINASNFTIYLGKHTR
ncbi:hypothetical protein FB451DRAFT_1252913 [Mycena latifolia]|nr:hypothetical protein FB451DRAFT_1252913 [Mycena latifolia]